VLAKPRFATRAVRRLCRNRRYQRGQRQERDPADGQPFQQAGYTLQLRRGSVVQDAPVTDVDMSVWQHTISLDLLGTFHCCRHGIPELTKNGGGAIVNMSSVAALRGFPAHVYVAVKGGIISLMRARAGEYAKNGIRANAICPGLVKTDRVLQSFGNPHDPNSGSAQAQAIKGQFRRYPFSVGEPEDIARIALFLASDEARMITGAIIPADGGLSAY
jgi:NAD(P)-dependent dehydrogenase (short-subunit alcohol dehydrogenase family)